MGSQNGIQPKVLPKLLEKEPQLHGRFCQEGENMETKELRIRLYERKGVKRMGVLMFTDGVGGKGMDVPLKGV